MLDRFSGRGANFSAGNWKCSRQVAVTVKKDTGEALGHVPKKISRICTSFLQHGGLIMAVVTGCCRYSRIWSRGG